jgi:hypothetical protein
MARAPEGRRARRPFAGAAVGRKPAPARTLPPALVLAALATLVLASCQTDERARVVPRDLTPRQAAFLDTLAERTFEWFRDLTDPRTGLTPDRWPTKSFVSTAAVGFGLTAWPIGVERGWMTRDEARDRALHTLEFFWRAPQDTARAGVTGHRGFFYHFLDPVTGHRFENVELSTVDTALLFAGMLFCREYFDRPDPAEVRIRALADSLYFRADWRWVQARPPAISHGWTPEEGLLPWDWIGYNEAAIVIVLALGSPTHPVEDGAWERFASGYKWGAFQGQEHLGFAPLFGHQYSHVWIDFRGLADPWLRARGIDYFENSRRATLAQRAYAIENPGGFKGYGAGLWGLTACDGPMDGEIEIGGRKRTFRTYSARGACFTRVEDDGTIAPTAAGGSLPFAPAECAAALVAMRETYGEHAFGRYGFIDAFNPTLDIETRVQHGKVVPGVGWFDTDQLGIDQGPILAMIENHRSDLVWRTMRKSPYVIRGLQRAGFTGGWLDRAAAAP